MNAQDLKNSILQLAIQGKLVEQRKEEGTAKELIEQIKAEKEQLIKAKKIKKEKPLPEIIEDEIPFDIPESWEWARLGNIEEINLGFTYRPEYTTEGVHFLSVKDISNGRIDYSNTQFVSEETYKKASYGSKPHKGDILFGRVGTIGKPQIIESDEKFCIFVSLGFLRDHSDLLNKKYICSWMDSQLFWKQVYTMVKGSTVKNLNTSWLKNFLVPIPPLEEQNRIVSKIEEIMPYIEKYGEAHSKLELFNKKFPEEMQKSILQYAIQGKLVEQREEEETAGELYKQIQEEKAKLNKEGKIKKEKPLAEITEDEIPFEIPESWKWVRLGNILNKLTDGTHSTPKYTESGIPFISVKDISGGEIDFSNTKYISKEEHETLFKRCNPERGDILLTKIGTTGIPVMVETDKEFSLFVSVALLKFDIDLIYNKYLLYAIKSPIVQTQCDNNTRGVGNKNWVMRDIANTILPLPPLEEQKRIVDKVEELIPYCKQLTKV